MNFRNRSALYAEQLYRRVIHSCTEYNRHGQPIDLHRARVALKRLLTLWKLNRKGSGKKARQVVVLWKAVFREAGTVRVGQINRAMIRKYAPDYQVDDQEIVVVPPHLPAYNALKGVLEKKAPVMIRMASSASFQVCNHFWQREWEQLLCYLLTGDEEFWHLARKKAKRIRYIFDLFREAGKEWPDKRLYLAVDRFQKACGDWHDLKEFQSWFHLAETNSEWLKQELDLAAMKVSEAVKEVVNSCSPEWLPVYLR